MSKARKSCKRQSARKASSFKIPKGYVLMPLIVDDKMASAMGYTLWQDLWDILVAEVGKK